MTAWNETGATVLDQLDTSSPTQKALSGMQYALVLHGDAVITRLRDELRYPQQLREAMVRDHLTIFPLWRMQEALAVRDAELWQRAELVNGLQHVLAILSGINEIFFSPFQLKHMHDLAASFRVAPPDLVERIEGALSAPTRCGVSGSRVR